MYDKTTARWMSKDPIGFEGSEWNLYEYVGGRPTVYVDPFGLEICCTDYKSPEDYARRTCRLACGLDVAMRPGCSENSFMADWLAAEEIARKLGFKEHNQKRKFVHCLGSARAASGCGCECTRCIADNREDYQGACQNQDRKSWPTRTKDSKAANAEGRKCAGCDGADSNRDPRNPEPPKYPGPPYSIYPTISWPSKDKMLECCLQKFGPNQ